MKCDEFGIPISRISHFMSFTTSEKKIQDYGDCNSVQTHITNKLCLLFFWDGEPKAGKTARYSDQIFKS